MFYLRFENPLSEQAVLLGSENEVMCFVLEVDNIFQIEPFFLQHFEVFLAVYSSYSSLFVGGYFDFCSRCIVGKVTGDPNCQGHRVLDSAEFCNQTKTQNKMYDFPLEITHGDVNPRWIFIKF